MSIAEKVDQVENKVDTLESVLGTFIVSTNSALLRLEREMRQFKDEMRLFKNEMGEFKNEMREFKNESELDRKRMNKQWGELANKMGTLVEDIVAPNIPGVAKKYFGIEDYDTFAVRVTKKNSRYPEKRKEFDVILVTETHFILNETKATPRVNYIDMMIETLGEIEDWFPEYRGKTLISIFSSLYFKDDIARYLTKNRIFAMGVNEETMYLVNYDELSGILCGR